MAIETPTKVADTATTPVPTKTTDATSTTATTTTEPTTNTTADISKPSSTAAGSGSSAAEHQLKEAIRLKDEGNALYGKGDVQGAKNRWHHAHLYSSGISTFKHHLSGNAGAAGAATAAMAGGGGGELGGQPPKSELDKTAEQITLAVMNNLGSCYLAEKNYEKVLYATTKALRVEPNNIKANYRRARAYFELGDLQQAKDCVELAIEKGGGNDGAVKGLAAEINKKAAEKEAKAKSEWKGFLNKKEGAAAGGGGGGSPAKDVKGKGKAKEENGGGGDKAAGGGGGGK